MERIVRKNWERTSVGMPMTEGLTSMTKQSFKNQCDVNFIVEQFDRTGALTHFARGRPEYADVSESADLQTSIEAVKLAGENFAGLPSAVRAAAQNDPVLFLEMSSNQLGMDALVEAGLWGEKPKEPAVEPGPEPERLVQAKAEVETPPE